VRIPTATLLLLSCGADLPAADDAPTLADVVEVAVSGQPGTYTFAVTVRSPDAGCERYADWWEVALADGTLVHRRILAHSHVEEQPFTRSSGPVAVSADDEIIVRAHLAPGGYGGRALGGSVGGGFVETTLDAGWGAALESVAPQPDGCAF
jgi:hypothetical protein